MKHVNAIEMVLFKPIDGVDNNKVITSMLSLNSIVSKFKGFVSRHFAKNENGQWLDIVYWETMEDAKHASQQIMKNKEAMNVFSIINQSETIFCHFTPIDYLNAYDKA